MTGYCTLSLLCPYSAEEQTLSHPAPPSCANNVVNLSHLPSSIKTPVRKDVLILSSISVYLCVRECGCVYMLGGRY